MSSAAHVSISPRKQAQFETLPQNVDISSPHASRQKQYGKSSGGWRAAPATVAHLLLAALLAAALVCMGAMAVHLSGSRDNLAAERAMQLPPAPSLAGMFGSSSSSSSSSSGHSSSSMEALLAAVLQQTVKLENLAQQVAALTHSNVTTTAEQAPSQNPAPAQSSNKRKYKNTMYFPPPRPSAEAAAGVGRVHHVGRVNASCSSSRLKVPTSSKLVAPVVIVAYSRTHFLARSLISILQAWSANPLNRERFPLFVSVDDGHGNATLFASALHYSTDLQVISHERLPTDCASYKNIVAKGYCYLSSHYHFLLQLFLECHSAPRLLFLEEDLEVAPDFFEYFAALAPLLDDRRQNLLAVSAWNDHGQAGRAANTTALMRTDIMPGLGWMVSAAVGKELAAKWPEAYWDDFLRMPDVRRGRQTVFPEVSRTRTFGNTGASGGQLFQQHLRDMKLNSVHVNWTKQDLSYLHPRAYAASLDAAVRAAEHIHPSEAAKYCKQFATPHDEEQDSGGGGENDGDLWTWYNGEADFSKIAKLLQPMMTDFKGGVPRASFDGTVMVRCAGRRLFLTPRESTPAADHAPRRPSARRRRGRRAGRAAQ